MTMVKRSTRKRQAKLMPEFDYGQSSSYKVEPAKAKSQLSVPSRTSKRKAASPAPAPTIKKSKVSTESTQVKRKKVVATPTNDAVSNKVLPNKEKKLAKPLSLRSLINLDYITLEHLLQATPTMLVTLFGHLKADELSRQFIYYCQLMPAMCSATFKSFGNENKARLNLERHLLWHIREQEAEVSERRDGTKTKFTAESVQARARRLGSVKTLKQQNCQVPVEKLVAPEVKEKRTRNSRPLKRKPRRKIQSVKPPAAKELADKTSNINTAPSSDDKSADPMETGSVETVIGPDESAAEVEAAKTSTENSGTVEKKEKTLLPTVSSRAARLIQTQSLINKNTEWIEKMQEQIRLNKQPYKDHCYPILMKGKVHAHIQPTLSDDSQVMKPAPRVFSLENRSEWDNSDSDEEDDDVIHHDLARHYHVLGTKAAVQNTGFIISSKGDRIPVMQLMHVKTVPAVAEEVVIVKSKPLELNPPAARNGCIVESESETDEPVTTTTLSRPYPPMPKYLPEMGTKLIIPEEEMNFPDGDEDVPLQWDLENKEHVKKYAIRCMRELKSSRGLGVRNCTVSCKICDKQFTATATLMYHYRSHAEIKPFVCLLCNSTFTRQHSLNYHMLIHNDATRFKCPDCGRAFRHPSHYKEHRRKHTGEQPYQCPECYTKFKTRNSFKRHIAVKHQNANIKIKIVKSGVDYEVPWIDSRPAKGLVQSTLLPSHTVTVQSVSVTPTTNGSSTTVSSTLDPLPLSASTTESQPVSSTLQALPGSSTADSNLSSSTHSVKTNSANSMVLKMTTLCKNGAFSVTNFTPIKIVSATGNKSESRPSLVSPQVTQSGSGRLYAVPVYPAGVSNGNSKAAPVLVVPTSSIAPTSTTTNYTTVQTAAVEVPPADKANT